SMMPARHSSSSSSTSAPISNSRAQASGRMSVGLPQRCFPPIGMLCFDTSTTARVNLPRPFHLEKPVVSQPAIEPHVALQGVTKRFVTAAGSTLHAVGPIDLALARGEFFSVVGPSGCGKSTLLELIAGLTECSDGRIVFEGQ